MKSASKHTQNENQASNLHAISSQNQKSIKAVQA
jgi:hypothetical protein